MKIAHIDEEVHKMSLPSPPEKVHKMCPPKKAFIRPTLPKWLFKSSRTESNQEPNHQPRPTKTVACTPHSAIAVNNCLLVLGLKTPNSRLKQLTANTDWRVFSCTCQFWYTELPKAVRTKKSVYLKDLDGDAFALFENDVWGKVEFACWFLKHSWAQTSFTSTGTILHLLFTEVFVYSLFGSFSCYFRT